MRRLPNFSGLFCTIMLALGALALVMATPRPALAQTTCGVTVGMAKSCQPTTLVGQKDDCTITLTNNDACGNTYQVISGSDVINASGGDVTNSGLPISAVTGTTTCTVSGTLPCNLSTGASVTFHDNNYTVVSADFNLTGHLLTDTGTVNMKDLCDNNTSGCNNITTFPETAGASTLVQSCSVTIDKQISCGGAPFVDVGENDTNPPSGPECTGLNAFDGNAATSIQSQYVIHNTGTTQLVNCSATDSNGLLLGGTNTIDLGGTTTFAADASHTFTETAVACSSNLSGNEPDTATVSCKCGSATGPTVSDEDQADFACLTPGLSVLKNCTLQSAGVNNFTIDVTNTGAVDLTNCTVSDAYQANDTCTNIDLTGTTDATSSLDKTDLGTLAVGSPKQTVNGHLDNLSANACNEASVTCNVGSATGPTITSTSQDTCEVAQGCDTRTPGFWGTHLTIAASAIGTGLQSCGLTITQTDANVACSSTEDICSVGSDSNTLGILPQDMQLVRQCMAAELNFAISALDGGSCTNALPGIATTLEACCGETDSVCSSGGTSSGTNTVDSCISALDAFNNLETTIDNSQFFTNPGPADSSQCQIAGGDNFVNPNDNTGSGTFTGCGGSRTYASSGHTNNGQHKGQNK